jgi:molybdopterin-guanine dinucleotide biosynthesis protein B
MPDAALPPLVTLLGVSGSGKTTLAAALVGHWTAAGRRVGYVKHASHGFDMDRPGKDTARLTEAGAAGVAVVGPDGFAYLERRASVGPETIVARWFADRDVVVLEGFRSHGHPAVVVVGAAPPLTAVREARGRVLAVVAGPGGPDDATRAAAGAAPVFLRDDVAGLAAHLETALALPRGRRPAP